MTRESLKDMQLEEVTNALEADVVAYAEEIANTPKEELTKKEEELMEEFKAYDERIKDTTYELPKEITFEGETFKANEVHRKIIGFLNKLEVDFRATLGIWQAIRFWKNVTDQKVPYHVYDSTVRLLGTLKFKGEQECYDVLIVNNYFSGTHAEYSKDTTYLQYLSVKHNTILKAMEEKPEAVEEA